MNLWLIAVGLLALCPAIYAHGVEEHHHDDDDDGMHIEMLDSRETPATCGPSAKNAVCSSNQCCGPNGVCGTGGYYCVAPSCLFQYGPACDANQTPTGVNTTSIPRPKLGSVPYGISIRTCTVPGKVALTFDDGPYIYTSDLLDLLKTRGVKATFFIVGNNGGKGQINDPKTGYPALIQRMHKEGHQIGSHTWSHQDLSTLTRQQRYDQVIKNEMALADILGFFPTYLRPPYMSCNADCLADLEALGYHVSNYNIDTLDWQGNYPHSKAIYQGALQSGNPHSNGWIALAHDIHSQTVHELVGFMIDTLQAQGYTSALYGECLGDPQENWYRTVANAQSHAVSTSSSSTPSSIITASQAKSSASKSTGQTVHATPTAVQGGEGTFGSRTGNATETSAAPVAAAMQETSTPKSDAERVLYNARMVMLAALLGAAISGYGI